MIPPSPCVSSSHFSSLSTFNPILLPQLPLTKTPTPTSLHHTSKKPATMDHTTKNPFDNINVDIRRAADGKTNDYGEPPWPLAPWADSSYLPYTPTSHAPDPNPHGDVRARVVSFLDREAARVATPSSPDRPARCGATLQRLRVRATRRSERAVPRRAVASSFDAPAGDTSSPVEGVTAEAPVPQPFEFREAPARTVSPRLQSVAEGTTQSGAGAVAGEGRPDYLGGMVERTNCCRRERRFDRGGCNGPRGPRRRRIWLRGRSSCTMSPAFCEYCLGVCWQAGDARIH